MFTETCKRAILVGLCVVAASVIPVVAQSGLETVDVTVLLERPSTPGPVNLEFAFWALITNEKGELDLGKAAIHWVNFNPKATASEGLRFEIPLLADTQYQLEVNAYDPATGEAFPGGYYYKFSEGELEKLFVAKADGPGPALQLNLMRKDDDAARTNRIDVFSSPSNPNSLSVSLWTGPDQVSEALSALGG